MSFRIYFQPPTSGATLRKLDQVAGVTLEILDPDERERDAEVTRVPGELYTASWDAVTSLELRMTWSRSGNDLIDWHARICTILDWMDRGASMGIARDTTKAGLWPLCNAAGTSLRGGVVDGATTVYLGGDFLGWETSPALAAEDVVSIESEIPEGQRWCGRATARAAGPPVNLTMPAMWGDISSEAWCRRRDFYPYLYRRPEDRATPALTQDNIGEKFLLSIRLIQILPAVELP